MNSFLKKLRNLLLIIYFGQLAVCLFFNNAETWSRWIFIEFHLVVWTVSLFLCAANWAYERINHKK